MVSNGSIFTVRRDVMPCPILACNQPSGLRRILAILRHEQLRKIAGDIASIADEIVRADGAAHIRPAALAPVIDKAGGPDVGFETLGLTQGRTLRSP